LDEGNVAQAVSLRAQQTDSLLYKILTEGKWKRGSSARQLKAINLRFTKGWMKEM